MNTQHNDVYQIITDRIIAQLEAGTIPWKKPWTVRGMHPQNLVSKKPYRGANVFLLAAQGFSSPYWLTFNQAKDLGATVRKGEKSTPVIFWKWLEVEDKETKEKNKVPFLRYYNVFNASQCDGLKLPTEPEATRNDPIGTAESIIMGMPQAPEIKVGQTMAYYHPIGDYVGMPDLGTFDSPEKYYATLFHELTHATGAEKRLNRKGIAFDRDGFGRENYSKEELVAEMGSAFLCGESGILQTTEANSAAYLANWLSALKNDRKLIVLAAGQAQKAADYILNRKTEAENHKTENQAGNVGDQQLAA